MSSFLSPSEIIQKYLKYLKSIKPSINTNDNNSDFVIRGKVFSGLLSGLYGDQAKVDNDTFVSSMRGEMLDIKGADYGIERSAASKATSSQFQITGTDGTVVGVGDLTLLYEATGLFYTNTTGGTIASGILDLEITCNVAGVSGNVAIDETLTVVSPPVGVDSSGTLIKALAGGSDIETDDSYRLRILTRLQKAPAGGNETDYEQWAYEADDSVRSVIIKRFGRGLGTVDIYITTGTTDIDTAVTQGLTISRIPSDSVLDTVQAYYEEVVPETDCPQVYAPNEIIIPVTVNVMLASGLTLDSIPSSSTYNPLGLTCRELIQREVSRVLYKIAIGGRVIDDQGYIVASDIEEGLDAWLSAVTDTVSGDYVGKLPILLDRQVQKLYGDNYNYPIEKSQLATPGVITVNLGV